MAELPGLRVGLALDSATFISETRRVNDSVNRMGRDITAHTARLERGFQTAAASVRNFGIGLAAAIGATSLTGLAMLGKKALDSAGNLAELAQQAGVATGELQALTLAGVQVGVSQEQLVTSLGQFGKRVGEAADGTSTLAKTMERYGIAAEDSSGNIRSSVDILADFADAVEGASSQQEQLAIATAAFGRAGAKLVPILSEGADGFREWMQTAEAAGLVIGDDLIRKADKASDAIATLQYAVSTGFQIGFVEAFNTELGTSVDKLTRAREAGEALGRALGEAFNNILPFIEEFNKRLVTTNKEIEKIKKLWAGLVNLFQRSPMMLAMPDFGAAADEIGPLTVDIKESTGWIKGWKEQLAAAKPAADRLTGATDGLADATAALTNEQKRLAEAGQSVIDMTAAEARALEETERRMLDQERAAQRSAQKEKGMMPAPGLEDVERQASEQASETQRIFENAADNIQTAFADAFTDAFEGNITSAQDFADTLKSIFTRTAGEIAAAMVIKPVLATLPGMAPPGTPGTPGATGGRDWYGGAGSGAFFTAPTTPTGGQAVGGAAFGGATGFTVGQTQYGGHTGATVGGTIGGTAGGAAGSFFGPGGAAIGGFAGAQLGAFIGRQFGAGQGQDNKVSFQGQLGIGAGGTGAAAQLVASIDKSIMSLLDATEEGVTNRMLEVAKGVSVQYDKEMSANDMAALAAGRIGPAAQALGLDAGRVAIGAPEEQFANLETALGLMRQIEDIELGPMGAELDNLRASFLEAAAAANKFGVDHSDALKEQYRLERQAIGRRFASERIGLEAAFGQRSATSAALAQLKLQFDEAAARAEQLGVSTAGMAAALADAQEEVRAQARAQRAAIITEARGLVGLPETFQSAFKALQQRFAELRSAMEDLGGSTAGLTVLKEKAIAALREERRAQLESIEVQARGLTGLQPTFRQALELLRAQFTALRQQTRALGGDLGELTTIQREAQQQLARQQRAEQDAMALSITEPFKQLQDPLLAFGKELTLGTLNPAGQMKAAQDEFRRIARLAQAGSTIAMQQLEGAGRAFIEQAGRFGASPALIEANLEVRSAIDAVSADLAAAQKAASRGVEDAIDKASRREVDTLREMIKEVQLVADEIKRLGRK